MGKINTRMIEHDLNLPNRYTKANISRAIQQWFIKNGLDNESNYVETRQGNKIFFTGISQWHFPVDVVASFHREIALRAITYLPEVFESGRCIQIQDLNKDRSNKRAKFVRFYVFIKKVKIKDTLVTIRAKAGEYPTGKIVLLPKLSAYTFIIKSIRHLNSNKKSVTDLLDYPNHSEISEGVGHIQITSARLQSATPNYDNVYLDDIQDELATFEILAIEETMPKTDAEFAFDSWLVSWLR